MRSTPPLEPARLHAVPAQGTNSHARRRAHGQTALTRCAGAAAGTTTQQLKAYVGGGGKAGGAAQAESTVLLHVSHSNLKAEFMEIRFDRHVRPPWPPSHWHDTPGSLARTCSVSCRYPPALTQNDGVCCPAAEFVPPQRRSVGESDKTQRPRCSHWCCRTVCPAMHFCRWRGTRRVPQTLWNPPRGARVCRRCADARVEKRMGGE